jgi:hypothetical protein
MVLIGGDSRRFTDSSKGSRIRPSTIAADRTLPVNLLEMPRDRLA